MHLDERDGRRIADHETAFPQILDFERSDLGVRLAVVIDEIVEIGALVCIDATHRLTHGAIEGRVSLGVNSVGCDLGAVEEGGADRATALFVSKKVPAKTVAELIEYIRANDGKVTYGSSGNGTSSHLSSVMFQLATQTTMTHVPFRSTAEVVNSMLGGNIDLAIDSMTTVWPFALSGNVRALAVTTPQRSTAAPDLPTIGETLNGYEATAWQGLFAPAGTARPIVERIAAEVKRIWELPEVVTTLKNVGADPAPSTPDEFTEYSKAERAKWGKVVKASGVQID